MYKTFLSFVFLTFKMEFMACAFGGALFLFTVFTSFIFVPKIADKMGEIVVWIFKIDFIAFLWSCVMGFMCFMYEVIFL